MPAAKMCFVIVFVYISASFGCEDSELPLISYQVSYNATYRETLKLQTITTLSGVVIDVVHQFIPKLCCKMINFSQELNSVNFNSCNIGEIESCFSENIRDIKSEIAIVNNRITTIRTDTFRNLSVQVILLEHNSIKRIEDAAFNHLPNLERLRLNNNHLKILNPNAFEKTPKLQCLYLYCNDITFLQESALAFFQQPDVFISLLSNSISNLNQQFLKDLPPQIRLSLDLTNNNIKRLDKDIFSNHVLTNLELGYNPLVEIDTDFCNRSCTIERFTASCGNLDNSSAAFLFEWIKINKVDFTAQNCTLYNFSETKFRKPVKCKGSRTNYSIILLATGCLIMFLMPF